MLADAHKRSLGEAQSTDYGSSVVLPSALEPAAAQYAPAAPCSAAMQFPMVTLPSSVAVPPSARPADTAAVASTAPVAQQLQHAPSGAALRAVACAVPATAAPCPSLTDVKLVHGDCIEGMRNVAAASVDVVIADPPYNIGVQGSAWDKLPNYLAWSTEWLQEAARVLKPGGSLFIYGSPAKLWISYLKIIAAEQCDLAFMQHLSWVYKQGGDSRLRGMTAYSVRMEHVEWFVKPGGSHTFNASEAAEHYSEEDAQLALAKGVGRVTAEALQQGRPPRNWFEIPRENSRSKARPLPHPRIPRSRAHPFPCIAPRTRRAW